MKLKNLSGLILRVVIDVVLRYLLEHVDSIVPHLH